MEALKSHLTIAEFAELDIPGRHDLVDGELWSMPPAKIPHGRYAARLIGALSHWVEEHGGGEVFAGELGFMIGDRGDTVLCPDVSFVRSDRIPSGNPQTFFPGAPDLAIEIISESERPHQVQTKVALYLAAGTAIVWCVYPQQRQIVLYTDNLPPRILGDFDTLEGGHLLPRFELRLDRLFV